MVRTLYCAVFLAQAGFAFASAEDQQDDSCLLQKVKSSASNLEAQPFGEIPAAAIPQVVMSNPVPDGSQMGRILLNTALNPNSSCAEGQIPVGQCPPPGSNMATPPDGSGLGPMIFEKSVAGLPGKPFLGCSSCPTCANKQAALLSTISAFKDLKPTPGCQAPPGVKSGGTSSAFGALQPETLVWSILGYGATNHGCFGHTFVNLTELNNPCYSFGARIQAGVPYFRPVPEDILIDSCGKKASIRLFCPDCKPRSLCPTCEPKLAEDYPQRYTWQLQLEDDPTTPFGFVITKLNAVLDTELTMDASIQDYDFDPWVCQVLKPLAAYPPISPRTYRLELPVETLTNCSECPDCPSRAKTVSDAFDEYAEGNVKPFMELLAPDVEFIVAGAGPTQGGCGTAIYHNRTGYFEETGFWGRMLARSEGNPTLMASDITTNSCGDRANIYYAWGIKGKSQFRYTLTGSWTLYYESDGQSQVKVGGGSAAGFKIVKILQNHDTEVMMNMAVRERAFDPVNCPLTPPGGFGEAVSHTILQP